MRLTWRGAARLVRTVLGAERQDKSSQIKSSFPL
jgi:hypothetical protein